MGPAAGFAEGPRKCSYRRSDFDEIWKISPESDFKKKSGDLVLLVSLVFLVYWVRAKYSLNGSLRLFVLSRFLRKARNIMGTIFVWNLGVK